MTVMMIGDGRKGAKRDPILQLWYTTLHNYIHSREEIEWKKQMDTQSKLRTYRQHKVTLQLESYLLDEQGDEWSCSRVRSGRHMWTRLRSGTSQLRIETERWIRGEARLEYKDRLCLHCDMKQVEDESHMLMYCPSYTAARNRLYTEMERQLDNVKISTLSETERMKILFVGQVPGSQTDNAWLRTRLKQYHHEVNCIRRQKQKVLAKLQRERQQQLRLPEQKEQEEKREDVGCG